MMIHAANWNIGQNSNNDATPLAPVNPNLLYPTGEPSFAVTSLWYQQALGDRGFAAMVGRYDLLDVWNLFYPDFGRGVDGFQNVSSFVPFNIVTLGLPLISNLAGIVKAGEQGVEAGFLVFENANHPTNVGLNFPNGVTMLGVGRKYTNFGGLRGTHTLAAWYATGDFTPCEAGQHRAAFQNDQLCCIALADLNQKSSFPRNPRTTAVSRARNVGRTACRSTVR